MNQKAGQGGMVSIAQLLGWVHQTEGPTFSTVFSSRVNTRLVSMIRLEYSIAYLNRS